ncbi:MAG: hypothetical protein JXA66_00290 [Oligoflexia bacterium]|nr:hypothetical protein [Oligoflexia bacterium]
MPPLFLLFLVACIYPFSSLPANIDINSDKINISLMGDLEGTSIILKIKDDKGKKIGVFKPSSGSTNHRGEYAMTVLGHTIGFDIFPDAIITSLKPETINKVINLLENVKFTGFYGAKHVLHMKRKEQNRKSMIQDLKKLVEAGQPLEGVLKLWVYNIQFYVPLGSMRGFSSHQLKKYLNAKNSMPEHKPFIIKQCTKLFKPYGCYYGHSFEDEIARDMSSLLLLDAILANRDRFAGGNIHFRSVDGKVIEKENKFIYPAVRLLALDNGAVLFPNDYYAFKLLKKFNISRFVKKHVTELKKFFKQDNGKIADKLKLTGKEAGITVTNAKLVFNYIDGLEKKYGGNIWFKE